MTSLPVTAVVSAISADINSNERNAALARLATSELPKILFITHALGGGTERHIQDLLRMLAETAEILVLKPVGADVLSLQWAKPDENLTAYFSGVPEYPQLVEFLKSLSISRVHLHHIDGHPKEILNLAASLGAVLDVTLHDHFPITPQYYLDEGGIVPARQIDHVWHLSNAEWRSQMHRLLKSAARVICPSRYIATRIAEYFPDIHTLIWPHPETAANYPANVPRKIKVLVLGRMTPSKGLNIIEACAKDAKARNLPLQFVVLGPTVAPLQVFPELPITVKGSYAENDLPELIALERADAFLFPSQIPESFSYTLTVALETGLPIIASRLGAFIERLESAPQAVMLDWNSAPDVWNDALQSIAVLPSGNRNTNPVQHNTPAQYLAQYLAEFSAAVVPTPVTKLALKAAFFYPPKKVQEGVTYSLPDLYSLGVVCGQDEARQELVRRIDEAEHQIVAARESAEAAHTVLRLRDQDVDDLNLSLQQAQADYGALQRHFDALDNTLEETRMALEETRMALVVAIN